MAACKNCVLAKHHQRYDSNSNGYRDKILMREKRQYNKEKRTAADLVTQPLVSPGLDEFL